MSSRMNRWGIKKFLGIIFAIQLAIIGLVVSAFFGFDIPVIRQIIGFIYLSFVPGFLILRILKLHKIGIIETLLYSVGLSIAFVMFTGFFINAFYPLIGISRPISIFPVIVTITFIVLILCVVAYKLAIHEEEPPPKFHLELFSPPALFLLLLPLFAVLGTSLVNSDRGNFVSLIFLALVAVVVILVAFDKFIPTKLYPLAVVAIGLGLLWQWTLISPDLTGFDIHHEYYVQNLVLRNSVWNPDIPWTCNAMLSVVMLAPIQSLVLNSNTVWVFKIFIPLLFSLVPLALFQAYRKQTDDKIAFLAAFFFMSWITFFGVIIDAPRQQVAELFLALSVLLVIDKEIATTKRATLLIIFAFSIVVSHYGVSYIYLLYLLMALPLLHLWNGGTMGQLWERIAAKLSKFRQYVGETYHPLKLQNESTPRNIVTVTYVMLFVVFCLSWYICASSGELVGAITRIGCHIYSSMSTEIFALETRGPAVMVAIGAGSKAVGILQHISRTIHYATLLFIVVGVIELIINLRKTRFHPVFVAMVLASMAILAMCVILPHFATALNMNRIYHITLLFLAPFCILGGMTFFRLLFWLFSRLLHHKRSTSASHALVVVVILVLVPYFLFNTGFVREVTGNTPGVMTLSFYDTDFSYFTKPEISARKWLANDGMNNFVVYSDIHGYMPLYQVFCSLSQSFPRDFKQIGQRSYIFLRRWNIVHGEVLLSIKGLGELSYIDIESEEFTDVLSSRNKVYSSGVAQIYK